MEFLEFDRQKRDRKTLKQRDIKTERKMDRNKVFHFFEEIIFKIIQNGLLMTT